jgi:hypothetical protein
VRAKKEKVMAKQFDEGVVLLREPFRPNRKLIAESIRRADERERVDYERTRNLRLAKVWKLLTPCGVHYSISVTGPDLTLTKRLDVLRRALEAAYDAGAKSARSPG